jgi:hypothetical protein
MIYQRKFGTELQQQIDVILASRSILNPISYLERRRYYHMRPIVLYAAECWTLFRTNEK